MAEGKLKPAARALVHKLGISAKTQHRLKLTLNKLGLYDDDQLRVFREVERVVKRSETWLQTTQDGDNSRKKVLFWPVRGALLVNVIEALWAHVLNAHGAESHVFICDNLLPLCDHRSIVSYKNHVVDAKTSARLCDNCYFTSQSLFNAFELPVHTFSELIGTEDIERAKGLAADASADECFRYEYEGQRLGHIVYSSVLKFLLRETLGDDPHTLQVIRDFLAAAIVMTDVSRRALDQFKPDLIVLSHGIYVNWGVMTEVAKQRGVPVVVWDLQYRKNTLTLSHNRTYHAEHREESIDVWDKRTLTPDEENEIDQYLVSRRVGMQDYITYHPNPEEDKNTIIAELGLDTGKKTVGLFTNLIWDARVVFAHTVFPGMFDWVRETIDYYLNHPETQLVIRAHPAETKGRLPTLEKLGDQIAKWYPQLPEHIKVIPPESDISSYTLGEIIDAALVYTSKIGLELSVQGVPVVVAGDAFYAGKGFTLDPQSTEDYFDRLNRIGDMGPISEETRRRAKKYAHHFFFRKMLPFSAIDNQRDNQLSSITIDSLADLAAGSDTWLDMLAERSFSGEPFIFDLHDQGVKSGRP